MKETIFATHIKFFEPSQELEWRIMVRIGTTNEDLIEVSTIHHIATCVFLSCDSEDLIVIDGRVGVELDVVEVVICPRSVICELALCELATLPTLS